MNIKDLEFRYYEAKYGDYWFNVTGETQKELTEAYMEQSMIAVTGAVYSIQDGAWAIERQFPFNKSVITPEQDPYSDKDFNNKVYALLKQASFAELKRMNQKG